MMRILLGCVLAMSAFTRVAAAQSSIPMVPDRSANMAWIVQPERMVAAVHAWVEKITAVTKGTWDVYRQPTYTDFSVAMLKHFGTWPSPELWLNLRYPITAVTDSRLARQVITPPMRPGSPTLTESGHVRQP